MFDRKRVNERRKQKEGDRTKDKGGRDGKRGREIDDGVVYVNKKKMLHISLNNSIYTETTIFSRHTEEEAKTAVIDILSLLSCLQVVLYIHSFIMIHMCACV